MKISTKGRYGLRALVDLAANAGDGTMSLVQTTQRQNLSLNYLEQVFSTLRKAGIVTSVKGSGGGYALARGMDEITAGEVLEALEGKFAIVDQDMKAQDDPLQTAIKNLLWDEIDRRVNDCLKSRTLGSLVREYKENLNAGTVMYYI